ncbi:MAG: hypothetical protein KAZ87_01740 [Spirochaetes bacterium]|nr:hypothetical protein [Spirochaetota bacterium]
MNNIRTTALIEADCMKLVNRIADERKVKLSKIIELVFMEIIKREYTKNKIRFNTSVKYQTGGVNIVLLHYSVSADVYEACLDLRKFGKMSVSRILNEGIMLLFGTVKTGIRNKASFIEQFIEKLDNYVLIYYILRREEARTGLIKTEIHLRI